MKAEVLHVGRWEALKVKLKYPYSAGLVTENDFARKELLLPYTGTQSVNRNKCFQ
jgi:hypothetical protein